MVRRSSRAFLHDIQGPATPDCMRRVAGRVGPEDPNIPSSQRLGVNFALAQHLELRSTG